MKKFLIGACAALFGHSALAGEAVIPYWHMTSSLTSCLAISNVTDSDMYFKVVLYKQDGTKFTGGFANANNISALDTDTLLPPRGTAEFCLARTGGNQFGHGFIETKGSENSNGKPFAVAHGRIIYMVNGHHSTALPVNNGMPF